MRVAIMGWYGPKFPGMWNYYLNMARVLKAFAPQVQICMFHSPDLGEPHRAEIEAATGEAGREMPIPSRLNDVLALAGVHDRGFARLCADAQIDVVFEQARFLGRNFPIPVLSWIADLQHRALPHYFTRFHRLQRDVGYYAQTMFRQHVLVSSQSAQKDLLRFIPNPTAKIHVVPFAVRMMNPISDDRIADVRRAYGLEGPYLFLPNQLWRHKNHLVAFRALAALRSRRKPWTLVLTGQKHDYRHIDYAKEVAALEMSLSLNSQIRWLGMVPYDEVVCLIAGANALLNPSLFEGWSTTVEEAKALGTQMVLSSIDVHREQSADRAFLFDPAEPEAMADAVEAAAANAPVDPSSTRAEALARNLKDQRIYAARLVSALEQTIIDFH